MSIFLLTCPNKSEANAIISVLLQKHLVACAKTIPVSSSFWWEGKIDSSEEVLVILESIEEKFEKVEQEVAKLHSDKIFMLFSIPIYQTTEKVLGWIKNEVK